MAARSFVFVLGLSCWQLFAFPNAAIQSASPPASVKWHHPLYLAGQGFWAKRVQVVVRNSSARELVGFPLGIPIGHGPDELDLVGTEARTIRVVDSSGRELLFSILGPQGEEVLEGVLGSGFKLVVPIACPPNESAVVFIYFENPQAWLVPEFLSERPGLVNGDFEHGADGTPTGWRHDPGDATHQVAWTRESPVSGWYCLKTLVAPEAEPSWISTRQLGIPILGKAKYRLRGWVRAENVTGIAGWYIHVGDAQNPMILAPVISAGEGTFPWKEVQYEFTAPQHATRASVGTVLRGTGTAWFDRVRLELLDTSPLEVAFGPLETMTLVAQGDSPSWPAELLGGQAMLGRASIRVFNLNDQLVDSAVVLVPLNRLRAHLHGRPNRENLSVYFQNKPIAHHVIGDKLLIPTSIRENSVNTFYVYFSASQLLSDPSTRPNEELFTGSWNRVKNPSFEIGDELPADWLLEKEREGVVAAFDHASLPGLGRRCVRLQVSSNPRGNWYGWRQRVAVQPGKTYLVAAWVKCQDVQQGEVRVHLHRRTRTGELSKSNPMTSIGPGLRGSQDWTLLAGVLTIPDDTEILEIHLTTNAPGILWHDGVLVVEAIEGVLVGLEARPDWLAQVVTAWQVPALEKVFHDTIPREPPAGGSAVRLAAARGEGESAQIAVLSKRDIEKVSVRLELPRNVQGACLDQYEVSHCGFVPVDYPSNYYQVQAQPWERKIPNSLPGCDGWPGWWPDPLLPASSFKLSAYRTESIWLTFRIPKTTLPGDYHGCLRLVDESSGQDVAELPLEVRVWDFELPERASLPAIYDVRLGPGARFWGAPFDEAYQELGSFLAERRLCADLVHPGPRFQFKAGHVTADFGAFDKAAQWYFETCRFPVAYTPRDFYLFGWGHPPKALFGIRPYPGQPPYEQADRSRLEPEYKRVYQEMLRLFWNHICEKGWDDRFILYISDEPFEHLEPIRVQMKALCDMIHEVDPSILIYSSTWRYFPAWRDALDIWGVGHDGRVPVQTLEELRLGGKRIWFTTDGQMCLDTPYAAIERLLPYYCFKYGAEAYEFWGVSWYTFDPYRFGWHSFIRQSDQPGRTYWVRYPNGDGFLIYPGRPLGFDRPVSSIRLEQAREGVEDFEYLRIASQWLRRIDGNPRFASLRTELEQALKAMLDLVHTPSANGRYSLEILPDPQAVYRARFQLGEAITAISKSETNSP